MLFYIEPNSSESRKTPQKIKLVGNNMYDLPRLNGYRFQKKLFQVFFLQNKAKILEHEFL